jgi:hypothetical protein
VRLSQRNALRRQSQERYASIREWSRETGQRAFSVQCDPDASPEEQAEAWRQATLAGERRIQAHKEVVW